MPYPSIQVPDVVLAMGDLARYSIEQMRAQGELTVIGITGSAGKTTTKDLLAAIFTPEARPLHRSAPTTVRWACL